MDDVQTYLIKLGFSPIYHRVLLPTYEVQNSLPNWEICDASEGNEWIRCRKFAKTGHLRLKLLQAINYPQPSLFAKLIKKPVPSTF